jgi:hypothetical protein
VILQLDIVARLIPNRDHAFDSSLSQIIGSPFPSTRWRRIVSPDGLVVVVLRPVKVYMNGLDSGLVPTRDQDLYSMPL